MAGRCLAGGGLGLDALGGFAGLAFFQVVGVIARLHGDAVVFEGDDLIADPVEEVAIVGNDDDRAVEHRECFFQHPQRGQIEVVGRLVEHDDVAAVFQNLGQHQPRPFATGKQIDALVDALVVEEEAAQVVARAQRLVAEHQLFIAVGNFIEQRARAVELHPRLVDVVDLHPLARDGRALGWFDLAEAKFEQGRLAHAVAADDSGALAGAQAEREIAEQPARRGATADVDARTFQFDDDIAQIGRRRDEQVHFALFGRRFHAVDFVKLVESAARFGSAGFDAGAHPFELLAQESLAAAFGLAGDLLADRLRFEERGVVAGVGKRAPLVDLDDPRGDDVEEVAIVSHEDHRTGKAFEIIFQPADRLGVEVVGRLVEQQQIRLASERAAERDAAFFTAGKRADDGV